MESPLIRALPYLISRDQMYALEKREYWRQEFHHDRRIQSASI